MYNLLATIALTKNLPQHGLLVGDLGAIVEVLAPEAFEVEFVAASGKTQALVTLQASEIRALGDEDLLSVRPRTASTR